MKKRVKGIPIVKSNDDIALHMEETDIEKFIELSAAVANIDQVIQKNNHKMPQEKLMVVINERKNVVIDLEKFVKSVYKKYRLDDSTQWAFDVSRGDMF